MPDFAVVLARSARRELEALACVQALFMIERGIDRAPPETRGRTRREKSKPIVERFFAWCAEQSEHALEGSPL